MAMKFQYGLLVSSWSANFQYHLCSAQMPRDGNIVWKPMRDWAPKPNSQVSVGELKCLTWLAVWSLFNSPRSEIWFETLGSQSGSTRDNAPWKLRNIIDMNSHSDAIIPATVVQTCTANPSSLDNQSDPSLCPPRPQDFCTSPGCFTGDTHHRAHLGRVMWYGLLNRIKVCGWGKMKAHKWNQYSQMCQVQQVKLSDF